MDTYHKELDEALKRVVAGLKEDLRGIRSGRPSVEFVENLSMMLYDTPMTVKQAGTATIVLPREVRITLWDKGAVPAVMKAITDAQAGFTVSNDGTIVRAVLSPLSAERREEMGRQAKKTAEGARIGVRNAREDAMKKVKAAETAKEVSEDQARSGKEKMEKRVKEANEEIERMVEEKLKELAE
jgi:ribosome recycling factor